MSSWPVRCRDPHGDLSPDPRLVTSSLQSRGWRSRTPASRSRWWTANRSKQEISGRCKELLSCGCTSNQSSFSFSPDLSLRYDVIHHHIDHCPGSKCQRVRQQRFCQNNSHGAEQPGHRFDHAAELPVPDGGTASSISRRLQRLTSRSRRVCFLPEGRPGGEPWSTQRQAHCQAFREILDADTNRQISDGTQRVNSSPMFPSSPLRGLNSVTCLCVLCN